MISQIQFFVNTYGQSKHLIKKAAFGGWLRVTNCQPLISITIRVGRNNWLLARHHIANCPALHHELPCEPVRSTDAPLGRVLFIDR